MPTRKERWRARLRSFRTHPIVEAGKSFFRLPVAGMALWRDRNARCRHELAVCTIFKDEARFLDEWIRFHRGVGVEQFYLYDNGSSDDFRAVLAPWIDRGIVTLLDCPGIGRQVPAYNDCIVRFRDEARWIAFIDVDEFLFSPAGRDLRPILAGYPDLPAIFVYWFMYGANGHVSRPSGPLLEAYTRRAHPYDDKAGGKVVVNPRLLREMIIHHAKTWIGRPRDEKRRESPFNRRGNSSLTARNLRINHYWSRSIEDLHDKVRRGDASRPVPRDIESHLLREQRLNEVEDAIIVPLWREIVAEEPGTLPPRAGA